MKLKVFLNDKLVTLCMLSICGIYGGVALFSAGVDDEAVLIGRAGFVLLALSWLLVEWLRACTRLRRLQKLQRELKEPYLMGEVLPQPRSATEVEYFAILRTVSRSAIGEVELARREKREYCEFVESWVHEIKTPLTACGLILANDADPRKLKKELKRADNLTETILYYARLRTAEKDVQIGTVSLREVMDHAVRSEMELLIAAGISVEVEGDLTAMTDAKQLEFILKQLLINCAKYCKGCHVRLRAAEGCLTVEDNGPGIPAHELPRVTERGFTGARWRSGAGSTGMGLYIVKQLCEQLGVSMEIVSQEGAFTRVIFSFVTKL